MDLVTSCQSDESEAEKKSNKSKTPQKRIEIIELDDTDSDFSPIKTPKETKPPSHVEDKTKPPSHVEDKTKPPSHVEDKTKFPSHVEDKTKPPRHVEDKTKFPSHVEDKTKPPKVIECIDIDESSDDEESEAKNKKKDSLEIHSLSSNVESNKSQEDSKKNDYLNLHGSDSDDEQQTIQDNVSNLLNSAAILSDVQCGPQNISSESATFPDVVLNPSSKLDPESRVIISPVSKSFDNLSQYGSRINTPDLSSAGNDKNYILTDNIAHKRIKRETETPKSCTSVTNVDVCENEEFAMPGPSLYRKDERINGAYAKSVCRLPRQITRNYTAHSNTVTSLNWCITKYSHLLLSSSADCTVKIWDIYCKHPVQRLKSNLGLKAAKWSITGEQIVTGGYGKKAHVFDVLSGKEIISYDIFHHVNSIEMHPYMEDIFLCGTRNAIFGFDLRVNASLPIRTFLSKCEEVLDIVFLDENEFVCSTSVVSHDSADRTIMVWDFSTGAIMSNQIYLECYTCPSLKVHPCDSCFIAQTNGDYIAAFSTCKPYKVKDKIYRGHKVSGFGIECDISPDGKYVASGDANGDIYFYNYANTTVINKLSVRPNIATNKVKWHPALNSTLAAATWDGHVQIWK